MFPNAWKSVAGQGETKEEALSNLKKHWSYTTTTPLSLRLNFSQNLQPSKTP